MQFGESSSEPAISLPAAEGDPYGIREKCEEYGCYSFVPQYLPDGFVLHDIQTDSHDNVSLILFDYRCGDAELRISYLKYMDAEKWKNSKSETAPEDDRNTSEEIIAGIPVQFSWNWRYADAGFTDAENQIVCGLSSEHIGIEEFRKIVYSMIVCAYLGRVYIDRLLLYIPTKS